MPKESTGNCFICGAELGRVKMKNHVVKAHTQTEGGEDATLVRVEGRDAGYWLVLDMAADATLEDLDAFLREIWLECCGHLSAFYGKRSGGRGKIGMTSMIRNFSPGDKLDYIYDMGTSTELTIAIVGHARRPAQNGAVRLLARNAPEKFTCDCGKPAAYINVEYGGGDDNPFVCDVCADADGDEDMLLPIVNSPRMGECGYCGEQDVWTFDPALIKRIDSA